MFKGTFSLWFKQYFICSFTCKQIYTPSNVPGSDGNLEAYKGHFLFPLTQPFIISDIMLGGQIKTKEKQLLFVSMQVVDILHKMYIY